MLVFPNLLFFGIFYGRAAYCAADGHVGANKKASLVKGRWTPKAAGGILSGLALHAVPPAAGQESLRLAVHGTSL